MKGKLITYWRWIAERTSECGKYLKDGRTLERGHDNRSEINRHNLLLCMKYMLMNV
jgi:hypothetical protein